MDFSSYSVKGERSQGRSWKNTGEHLHGSGLRKIFVLNVAFDGDSEIVDFEFETLVGNLLVHAGVVIGNFAVLIDVGHLSAASVEVLIALGVAFSWNWTVGFSTSDSVVEVVSELSSEFLQLVASGSRLIEWKSLSILGFDVDIPLGKVASVHGISAVDTIGVVLVAELLRIVIIVVNFGRLEITCGNEFLLTTYSGHKHGSGSKLHLFF